MHDTTDTHHINPPPNERDEAKHVDVTHQSHPWHSTPHRHRTATTTPVSWTHAHAVITAPPLPPSGTQARVCGFSSPNDRAPRTSHQWQLRHKGIGVGEVMTAGAALVRVGVGSSMRVPTRPLGLTGGHHEIQ